MGGQNMSFLAPLYALGLLAIAGPILLHLIRRQPSERQPFSSLIFLKTTPPRLTKRSRVNDWLLLLLRVLAICALAFAFARPYLRNPEKTAADAPGKRVVIMLDTSASMTRPDIWENAIRKVEDTLGQTTEKDELALISFDERPEIQVNFENENRLAAQQKRQLLLDTAKALKPSCRGTQLGQALQFAAELSLNDATRNDTTRDDKTENGREIARGDTEATQSIQIVLISDMQIGGNLRSLQSYAWPKRVSVSLELIKPAHNTNASISLLPISDSDQKGRQRRLMVQNAKTSEDANFKVGWVTSSETLEEQQTIQVPPGETRVITLPQPSQDCTSVRLEGDEAAFDNAYHFVQEKKSEHKILYRGPTNDDKREDLYYYLDLLPLSTDLRDISCESVNEGSLASVSIESNPLVVLASPLNAPASTKLSTYLQLGGTLLCVLDDTARSEQILGSLASLGVKGWRQEAEQERDYAMLSRIAYEDPLFSRMADPKFSDFSKIKIWKHRNLISNQVIPEGIGPLQNAPQTVASFDNGLPAITQHTVGDGKILIMSFGWQPSQSQLALSTKFLPLIDAMLAFPDEKNQRLSISTEDLLPFAPTANATITKPTGETIDCQETPKPDWIDQAGVYQYTDGGTLKTVAVNLPRQESNTETLSVEEFESLNLPLGSLTTEPATVERKRQIKDRELESRQSIWQWSLLAALVFICGETLLSSRNREVTPADTQKNPSMN